MDNYREDYMSRLHCSPYGIVRRLLSDILLFVFIVGIGLAMNSIAA